MPTITLNKKVNEAVTGMSEAAYDAVTGYMKEHGDQRRGAAMSALVMTAAFIGKPKEATGSEEVDDLAMVAVATILAAQGHAGIYHLLRAISAAVEGPLHAAPDTEEQAGC